eukprot:scaffold11693_cov115-Isochrysis_galbana.AAC.18
MRCEELGASAAMGLVRLLLGEPRRASVWTRARRPLFIRRPKRGALIDAAAGTTRLSPTPAPHARRIASLLNCPSPLVSILRSQPTPTPHTLMRDRHRLGPIGAERQPLLPHSQLCPCPVGIGDGGGLGEQVGGRQAVERHRPRLHALRRRPQLQASLQLREQLLALVVKHGGARAGRQDERQLLAQVERAPDRLQHPGHLGPVVLAQRLPQSALVQGRGQLVDDAGRLRWRQPHGLHEAVTGGAALGRGEERHGGPQQLAQRRRHVVGRQRRPAPDEIPSL